MKTKLAILILLLWATITPCFAQDDWVYIRTYNRYGELLADDLGRSKLGDIIDIRPVNPTTTPSETEKKEWAIIKVSGLTRAEVSQYKEPWLEQTGITTSGNPIYITKAYRKYKTDVVGLNLKVGLNITTLQAELFKNKAALKTEADLITYRKGQKWYALMKPFRKLARLILPYAYASTVTSTINKTGEDYNTLTLWEDAKDGDLVTAGTIQVAELYDDDGELLDNLIIDGSTTSADYYMKIIVPSGNRRSESNALRYGVAGALLKSADESYPYQAVIAVSDSYFQVEYLQIWQHISDQSPVAVAVSGPRWADNLLMKNCIIKTAAGRTLSLSGDEGHIYLENCLLYGGGIGSVYASQNNFTAYNCNIIGNWYSGDSRTTYLVKNCYAATFAADISGDTLLTSGAEDTTGTSAGLDNLVRADQFVDVSAGTEDFHLKAGAALIDTGTDLSGTFTGDLDGTARGATWDIGADEYAAAGGAVDPGQIFLF